MKTNRSLNAAATSIGLIGISLAGLCTFGCEERSGLEVDKRSSASKIIWISSARFKTNVATVEDALAKVKSLRGVTFDYKPQYGGPNKLGFIAEEAAAVIPQAVERDKDGRPCAMDYVAVVPVTVEAIKQLSAENTALKMRLDALEAASQSRIEHPRD